LSGNPNLPELTPASGGKLTLPPDKSVPVHALLGTGIFEEILWQGGDT
jgi:hypothetical protein